MNSPLPAWVAPVVAGTAAQLTARVLRLAPAPWVHPERIRQVVSERLRLGSDPDAAEALDWLERVGQQRGLPGMDAARLLAGQLARLGARVQVVGHLPYPPQLADAWPELGAPLWLFAASETGQLPAGPAVAVVGTRRASHDGLRIARDLGRLLGRHGVTVVSGMARGIDQAAHRGALEVGGRTVAVLGAGLDADYPRGSASLRAAVREAGGLVSEYVPGTSPQPRQFLWRNRIIAGLAAATVVVEGRQRSGALHTARLAAAQGREVFAVPGSLNQPTARAPLDLIRDGARPLTTLDEILEVVGQSPRPGGDVADRPAAVQDPVAAAIVGLLAATPVTPGVLAATSGHPLPAVLAAVADLTDRGLAAVTPNGVVATGPNRS